MTITNLGGGPYGDVFDIDYMTWGTTIKDGSMQLIVDDWTWFNSSPTSLTHRPGLLAKKTARRTTIRCHRPEIMGLVYPSFCQLPTQSPYMDNLALVMDLTHPNGTAIALFQPTSSRDPSVFTDSSPNAMKIGAIAGGIVGGVLVVSAALPVVVLYYRHRHVLSTDLQLFVFW
ncbi:uncharacterized protein EI90DRAFT_3019402 [Cantharellus anzutake]|uniref:uncharacterized protein n=1 Tax=Cantharellus anzutake TaxID=1750568 RepID=UPI001905CF08|nr:uncharacterized protein EI90DRAFT_3019402 [Cantharellus anzutake]KAF8324772.1 hypothetical protein EI90DRAFT_3019402 [Cantharellus anzutake]